MSRLSCNCRFRDCRREEREAEPLTDNFWMEVDVFSECLDRIVVTGGEVAEPEVVPALGAS